jgi:hypothetical protein
MMRSRLRRVVQGKLVLQAPRKEAKRQSDARECGHAAKRRIFAPTMHRNQDFYSGLRAVVFATKFPSVGRTLIFFDSRTTQEGYSTILYLSHSEEEASNSGIFCADYPELSLGRYRIGWGTMNAHALAVSILVVAPIFVATKGESSQRG